jgi:hypothetical protein
MGDIASAMNKVASDVLGPGEQIEVGTKCAPIGMIKSRALSGGLAGVVGMLVHAKLKKTPDHALQGEALPRDMALGLTDRRVVVFGLSTMTGAVAKVQGSIDVAQLAGVDIDEARVFGMIKLVRFSLRLADGSTLALEASGVGVPTARAFCAALSRATSPAERAAEPDGAPRSDQ